MKKHTIFLLLLITTLFSCDSIQSKSQGMESNSTSHYLPPPPPIVEEATLTIDEMEVDDINVPSTREPDPSPQKSKRHEKIIKRGFIDALTEDVQSGKAAVDHIVASHNSYYETESYTDSDYESLYSLSIRIPSDEFQKFLSALEDSNAKILSKRISTQNVTGEYYDIKVALENKEQYLKQYRQLLKKTGSVKDLLEVQERIRRLSEEMDVSKGRLTYLDDNVVYSTLTLTLRQRHERIISRTPNNITQRVKNAFSNGSEFFISVLLFVISIWPFIFLAMLLWLIRKQLPYMNKLPDRNT